MSVTSKWDAQVRRPHKVAAKIRDVAKPYNQCKAVGPVMPWLRLIVPLHNVHNDVEEQTTQTALSCSHQTSLVSPATVDISYSPYQKAR
jgi:hypothetical protein